MIRRGKYDYSTFPKVHPQAQTQLYPLGVCFFQIYLLIVNGSSILAQFHHFCDVAEMVPESTPKVPECRHGVLSQLGAVFRGQNRPRSFLPGQ